MSDDRIYQFCRIIITPVFRIFYHPEVVGAEKIPDSGRIILAGNHKHALDPILVDICTKRTVHALAKSELFRGFFGPFFKAVGAISVDLDASKNPAAYEKALEVLHNDGVINISPEAARNYTDKLLLPFKSGAVRMAMETGSRIIPYCIKGDYRFRSKNLKIVYGDALEVDNADIEKANLLLYRAIEKLLLEN